MDEHESRFLIRFGQRIRELRHTHHWSQDQLAEYVGLHRTYIGAVERGERNLSLINIRKLARVFELTVAELFEGISE